MKAITSGEFTHKVSPNLMSKEPILITLNGLPQSVIINVRDMDIDKIVDLVREVETWKQADSLKEGN